MFKLRHQEHSRDIKNRNDNSALSEHIHKKHVNVENSIEIFRIQFLSKERNSRNTTIAECQYIERFELQLNRKHELRSYPLTSKLTVAHEWRVSDPYLNRFVV